MYILARHNEIENNVEEYKYFGQNSKFITATWQKMSNLYKCTYKI